VTTDADRPFKPSDRFTLIHGEGVSRQQAQLTLISVLYCHDTVPDLVTLTCELAVSSRRALSFVEAAEIAAANGATFDSEGWFAASENDHDRLN
jgi:hypothetical protein